MSKFEIINFHSTDQEAKSNESKFCFKKKSSTPKPQNNDTPPKCDDTPKDTPPKDKEEEDKFSFSLKRKQDDVSEVVKETKKQKTDVLVKENQVQVESKVYSNSDNEIIKDLQFRLAKLEKEFSDFKTQHIRLYTNPEYTELLQDPPISY